MKKKMLIAVFATFMALSMTACGGEESGEPAAKSATASAAASEPAESAEPEGLPESGAVDDYDVSIGDCSFTTDYEGNPAIVVNYDFVNNSDENIAPIWALNMQAFQDGVQLEIAIVDDASAYDAGIGQREVQPGASLTGCQIAYVMTSTSPVEIQVSSLFGDAAVGKTFAVQ